MYLAMLYCFSLFYVRTCLYSSRGIAVSCPIQIHTEYSNPQQDNLAAFREKLAVRQNDLRTASDSGPVNPALSAEEMPGWDAPIRFWQSPRRPCPARAGKVEFPGDPMSLYAALSYASSGWWIPVNWDGCHRPCYNDLCRSGDIFHRRNIARR